MSEGKITKPAAVVNNLISERDRDFLSKILTQLQHEELLEGFKSIVTVDGKDWNVKKVTNGILFTMSGFEEEFEEEDEFTGSEDEDEDEDKDESESESGIQTEIQTENPNQSQTES